MTIPSLLSKLQVLMVPSFSLTWQTFFGTRSPAFPDPFDGDFAVHEVLVVQALALGRIHYGNTLQLGLRRTAESADVLSEVAASDDANVGERVSGVG